MRVPGRMQCGLNVAAQKLRPLCAERPFAGRRLPYDHRHRHASDEGVPYSFKNAHQLLVDFFAEVDRVLKLLLEK